MVRYFEDVGLGDELGPVERIATDESVNEFCDVWGNPGASRFTDAEAAQKDGLAGAIVPGIMSMAYMGQLLTRWAEGGSIRKLDVVFRQLVYHNVPVRIGGVVTDTTRSNGENRVECDIYLESREGARMVGGKAVVALPSRG